MGHLLCHVEHQTGVTFRSSRHVRWVEVRGIRFQEELKTISPDITNDNVRNWAPSDVFPIEFALILGNTSLGDCHKPERGLQTFKEN